MKPANRRLVRKLARKTLPQPEPDMTGWTSMERLTWEIERRGLQAMVRDSNENSENGGPSPPELWDAEEAKDAAILAERAAKAAAKRLAEHPGSAAAQINARATRETADTAARAAEVAVRRAEEAVRRAEEAKLRAPPEAAPAAEAQAPTETPAPASPSESPTSAPTTSEPKPKPRPRKRREPGMPKPQKQWWEERARWRQRGPDDYYPETRRPVGRCLTEYDPLTGEIIGDGYLHPEDDDW